MSPLFVDLFLGLFPLLASFDFACYLHNLQFCQIGSERFIERENVVQTDISTFGRLGQNPIFAACK